MTELKDRFGEFVSHMGKADRMCKPLKESGELGAEYHRSWVKLVNDAVELSQTIDKLSRAAGSSAAREEF